MQYLLETNPCFNARTLNICASHKHHQSFSLLDESKSKGASISAGIVSLNSMLTWPERNTSSWAAFFKEGIKVSFLKASELKNLISLSNVLNSAQPKGYKWFVPPRFLN